LFGFQHSFDILLLKNTWCFIWYVREFFFKAEAGYRCSTAVQVQDSRHVHRWGHVGEDEELRGQETVASLLQMSQPNISKRKRKTSVSPPRAVPKRAKRSDAFQDEIAIADIQSHWVSTHVLYLPPFGMS